MIVEVQWSELQRDPKSVAALLLTREDRANTTAEGAVIAARALRTLLGRLAPDVAAAALLEEFTWADVLPEQDRTQFVTDFVRAFQASALSIHLDRGLLAD